MSDEFFILKNIFFEKRYFRRFVPS